MAVDWGVNYLAVLGAAVASFVLGSLWYGFLFGKYWMKLMSFTPQSMKKMKLTPAKAMTLGFLVTLLTAFVLAQLLGLLNASTLGASLQLAGWLWLGISGPLLLGSFLWEGKSLKLWAFNASYRLLELLLMASILALWA